MTKHRNYFAHIVLLFFFTVFNQACGLNPIIRTDNDPVRIRYSTWQGDYPLVLAEALGLYKKYGIDVDLIFVEDYMESLRSFTCLEFDTTNAVLADTLIMAQNANIQIVWIQDQSIASLVSTKYLGSISELRGKRIGVDKGSRVDEMMLEIMLAQNNIRLDEVTTIHIDSLNVVNVLGTNIEAGFTDSFSTKEILLNDKNILRQIPISSPGVMVFQESWIKDNPDMAQGLINAWGEAVLFWESNPAESIELITPYYAENNANLPSDINESVIVFTLQQNMEAFSPGQDRSIYDIASMNIQYLTQNGTLQQIPNLDRLFNWKFAGREIKTTN